MKRQPDPQGPSPQAPGQTENPREFHSQPGARSILQSFGGATICGLGFAGSKKAYGYGFAIGTPAGDDESERSEAGRSRSPAREPATSPRRAARIAERIVRIGGFGDNVATRERQVRGAPRLLRADRRTLFFSPAFSQASVVP